MPATTFGIMTAPMQVTYDDVLRVWEEADAIPGIDHAWLFDHLMPIGGDPDGPAFEGWTLLSALAGQVRRLEVGLLVTSNRIRPPALLAKIAATVDVVSGGRMVFGIGVGSRPGHPLARREYEAHGLPFHDTPRAIGAFAEACTVIKRLWTEDEPFDFHGDHIELTGAFGNPKPLRRPPFLIAGRSRRRRRSPRSWPAGPVAGSGCWSRAARAVAVGSGRPAPRAVSSPRGSDRAGRRRSA